MHSLAIGITQPPLPLATRRHHAQILGTDQSRVPQHSAETHVSITLHTSNKQMRDNAKLVLETKVDREACCGLTLCRLQIGITSEMSLVRILLNQGTP